MYDLVGDRIQEIFDAQVVDIEILDRRPPDASTSPTRSSEGSASTTSPIEVMGFRKHRPRDAGAGRRQRATSSERSAEVGQPRVHRGGSRPSPRSVVPLLVGDRATGRDLAPEHRSGARVQRRRRAAPHDARREPERRARERPAVRGDPAAQRRARAHQRRPARARREPRDAGDVRPRRRPTPGHLRRAGGQYRRARPGQRARQLPVHHREGRALRRRPDGSPSGSASTSSKRENRSCSTPSRRNCSPSTSQPGVLVGERPKSSVWVPLVVSGRATGRDLAPEPRARARVQRGGPPPADDARGEPERRARERPAVRGDPAAQRRARAHQRRPARPRREPRDAGDVRPRRRPAPGDLRRAGGRHRRARSRPTV